VTEAAASSQPPALVMSGIGKAFTGGRPVLTDVTLEIQAGEVVALAGANGSGKSTLVKILAGYHQADAGQIIVNGAELSTPVRPHEVRMAGVRFVHQEKGFVPGMSVLDNLCLGRGYAGTARRIHWQAERTEIGAELEQHNVHVALDADAADLTPSERAKLAIIRALHTRSGEHRRIIVLDEATAAMGEEESRALGSWMRTLAATEKLGVLFIGHRPEELREVADHICVLRSGRIARTFNVGDVSDDGIVEALVGAPLESFYPPMVAPAGSAQAKLEVRHLTGGLLTDIDFSVAAGEILGITGIEGSGFEQLPYLLFDPSRGGNGTMSVDGAQAPIGRTSISAQLSRGVAFVPADRARRGFVDRMTVRENVVQPRLRHFKRAGFFSAQRERTATQSVIDLFAVVPAATEAKLSTMSGGNQQKVLLGKWLATDPGVLLLHEPTEGIDVMTKREIFRILTDQKARGQAIVIASIEYEDLAHVCDRVLVLGRGRIYTELAGGTTSGSDIMRASYAASIDAATAEHEGAVW